MPALSMEYQLIFCLFIFSTVFIYVHVYRYGTSQMLAIVSYLDKI